MSKSIRRHKFKRIKTRKNKRQPKFKRIKTRKNKRTYIKLKASRGGGDPSQEEQTKFNETIDWAYKHNNHSPFQPGTTDDKRSEKRIIDIYKIDPDKFQQLVVGYINDQESQLDKIVQILAPVQKDGDGRIYPHGIYPHVAWLYIHVKDDLLNKKLGVQTVRNIRLLEPPIYL